MAQRKWKIMTDEIKTDNVESEQKITDNSLTPAEFMAQRVGSPQGESEVAEESQTEEEVVDKSATETEEEEPKADVLSQLDIENLSELISLIKTSASGF